MISIFFHVFLLWRVVSGQSCDSGKGTCIDTNHEICSGLLVSGYCPGASNILCCEAPIACDSGKGTCINTDLQSCGDGNILRSGYCSGAANILCCEPFEPLPERCNGTGPSLKERSYLFTLDSQGFSGHPGALVYIPESFDDKAKEIELVVYIHGYNNCISNIVRSSAEACNCTAGADIREGYNLIEQFEKATTSMARNNCLFVAAEVAYDQAIDSPGRWAEPNLFKKYVDELLSVHLAPIIGARSVESVSRVRIFSHSGGYFVIGNMAAVGGVPQVRDLCLLDSLYADFSHFDSFVQSNLASFGPGENEFRFSSIYALSGGTYNNNQAMEQRAAGWITAANRTEVMLYDNTAKTLTAEEISKFSLIFKFSSFSHDDVPRNIFYDFLLSAL